MEVSQVLMMNPDGTDEPMTSLFVTDLDIDVTEAMLHKKFSTIGPILSIRIRKDRQTHRSLGNAYINFEKHEDAQRALDTLNSDTIKGLPMRIVWSWTDSAGKKCGNGNATLDESIDNQSINKNDKVSFRKKYPKKFIPGSEERGEEIFTFPFVIDSKTVEYISSHGRIMFIIRGPPGTAKSTLSSMLATTYPTSKICSADSYFDRAFVSKVRNKDSLPKSHEFCKTRVKEECDRGTHPIIVQNTHMKLYELQPYVDFAAQYGYTVIMAITLRKFEVNARVLAKTNKKGLDVGYFIRRLKQWEENVPVSLGWFLGPSDSLFLLNQGKEAMAALIGHGDFCQAFDVYSEEDILEYFVAKSNLFCVLTHCKHNHREGRQFYISDEVQDAYGSSTLLTIHGFVVTRSFLAAVVTLVDEAKDLLATSREMARTEISDHDDDFLAFALQNLEISASKPDSNKLKTTFNKDFALPEKTTVVQTDWVDDEASLNINNMSVIVLGQSTENPKSVKNVQKCVQVSFSNVADPSGNIPISDFFELDDGTKYLELLSDSWFVLAPKKMEVGAVFTGFYC